MTPQRSAAIAVALLGLASCAEFGPTGAPVMPPAPPPPTEAEIRAAETTLIEAFRDACLASPIDLSGAADTLLAIGFVEGEPTGPGGAWRRFRREDVIAELRVGESQPVQASNCLVASPVLSERIARAAGTRALSSSFRNAQVLGPEEAREITLEGTTVGLVDDPEFDGVAVVIETIMDERLVAGLTLIKTR